MARKTRETKAVKCPVCFRGKIIDAAANANMDQLQLYLPDEADKAEWFVKCPLCRSQIGVAVKK